MAGIPAAYIAPIRHQIRTFAVRRVLWFCWELPLVLFGVLDAPLLRVNAPETVILHALQILSAGVALGYLRLQFDSVLLPTFAHGLLNTMGAVTFFYLSESNPFFGDFAGPVGTALLAAIAIVLLQPKPLARITEI